MGSATTFAELIAAPASEKVVLAEIHVGQLLEGWSLTGGQTYTYEIDFLNETVTLENQTTETIRKEIAAVEEDGTALTEKTSVATVEANPGSYWHDTANAKLYVHTSGSDTPKGYVLMGFFWLYFATQGKILDGRYYEPYIGESGLPSLRQSSPNIHWGVSEIGGGRLRLINSRGYFDQIAKAFLWRGKTVRLLLGGDALAYSEYSPLFTGQVIGTSFSRTKFVLELKSKMFALLETLPLDVFSSEQYGNLDPDAQGRIVPRLYGYFDETQAPEATCINTNYIGLDTYQFKLCGHAIESIIQVYANHSSDAGWQPISHDNEDLAEASFTITDADFVVGSSRVKVALKGKTSGGALLEKGPHIVEDVLTSIWGYAATDLDEPSFTASKSLADGKLAVAITEAMSGLALIEKICVSDLAYFDENGEGKLRYRVWNPDWTGSETEIKDWDFVERQPEVNDDVHVLYSAVKVGYYYNPAAGTYLYAVKTNPSHQPRYQTTQELVLETYLREKTPAVRLAQRLSLMVREPAVLLSGDLKLPLIDASLGRKIKATVVRAPFSTAGGYSQRYFEITSIVLSMFPLRQRVTARDLLMEYGDNHGIWMAESAPNWGSASEEQRANSGFWCDEYGYADSGNEDSKNVSLWW